MLIIKYFQIIFYSLPSQFNTFEGGILLTHPFLNAGDTCEMMYVDTSHTHDCVLYFVPEEKVIFVGDAGYTNSPEKGQTYEKDKLQNFITCLESLDFEVLVNGHWSHESKESAMADYYEILENL